jgi:hypothetical protein
MRNRSLKSCEAYWAFWLSWYRGDHGARPGRSPRGLPMTPPACSVRPTGQTAGQGLTRRILRPRGDVVRQMPGSRPPGRCLAAFHDVTEETVTEETVTEGRCRPDPPTRRPTYGSTHSREPAAV